MASATRDKRPLLRKKFDKKSIVQLAKLGFAAGKQMAIGGATTPGTKRRCKRP